MTRRVTDRGSGVWRCASASLQVVVGGAVVVTLARFASSASQIPIATPSDDLPAGMACSPTPPPMLSMHLEAHRTEGGHAVVDARPLMTNAEHYCERVGFGDARLCDTRPPDDPQRTACDSMVTGRSQRTGRWGPSWYFRDEPCSDGTRCTVDPAQPFRMIAAGSGTFVACASVEAPVATGGSRCGSIEIP